MTDKTPETRFKLLESVNYPEDLRTLPEESLPILAHEIREFMMNNIARHKVPRYIKFVDSYPMNAAGKILKYKMREAAVEELGLQDLVKK